MSEHRRSLQDAEDYAELATRTERCAAGRLVWTDPIHHVSRHCEDNSVCDDLPPNTFGPVPPDDPTTGGEGEPVARLISRVADEGNLSLAASVTAMLVSYADQAVASTRRAERAEQRVRWLEEHPISPEQAPTSPAGEGEPTVYSCRQCLVAYRVPPGQSISETCYVAYLDTAGIPRTCGGVIAHD